MKHSQFALILECILFAWILVKDFMAKLLLLLFCSVLVCNLYGIFFIAICVAIMNWQLEA